MKRFFICMAAMAMMGMMMTSCQKDEGLSKDTFTATTENGNSKTHLDGLNLKWDDEGESIMVIGSNYQCAEYFATSVTNNNTCATFACREGDEVNADVYQIYYPATMVTENNTILLPAEQEYVENNVKGFPMYAETQGHAFQFTNLCGLFRLQLQKDDVVVRSISITTDKAVSGAFAVSTSAEVTFQFETYETEDNAQKNVALYCGENGVSIDELTDFNIYLPAGTYSTFDITITTVDGKECVKSLNGNAITINRNERVTLTREGEALTFIPKDAINGLFSVSSGRVVYFAKGNLQNINGEWRFAEHQWDYLGVYSGTAWDLFGWSTEYVSNFGMSTTTVNLHYGLDPYSGRFIDWGTQIGDGETWYTLSYNEWIYLLNTRQDAAIKRGVGTVTIGTNEIHGLILLPDAWTLPAGLSFNGGTGSWDRNQYTAAQWEQMETAGAVFLPAAGSREGTELHEVGAYGSYWSTSSFSEDFAYYMNFYNYDVGGGGRCYRYYGHSVRLVQDY